MKLLMVTAGMLLALYGSTALAQDAAGRVRGVYIQAAPGVLVDPAIAGTANTPEARRWADVQLQVPAPEISRHVLAEVPRAADARVGDWVQVQLEPSRQSLDVAPLPNVSEIVTVHPSVMVGERRPEQLSGDLPGDSINGR